MTYKLRYDRRFQRSLELLPGDVRSVARKLIAQLADNPRPSPAKELEGHPNFYRLWLPRHHRLVWHVLDEEGVVNLLYIGLKFDNLYERLGLGRRNNGDG
jgi:mRNA-degrading endonuclease RelE of RelBE toxin-antitoxin system